MNYFYINQITLMIYVFFLFTYRSYIKLHKCLKFLSQFDKLKIISLSLNNKTGDYYLKKSFYGWILYSFLKICLLKID